MVHVGLNFTCVIFPGQYEKRLRILDEHLLSTSNLTKFFKELKPSSCRSSVSSESRHLYKNPLLGQALDLLRRGRKEDTETFGGPQRHLNGSAFLNLLFLSFLFFRYE